MPSSSDYAGMAALSICEALLLAIKDHKLLPEREVVGILQDAAATHENAVGTDAEIASHHAVARLINGIISGGGAARSP